jgi:hypothetical protein
MSSIIGWKHAIVPFEISKLALKLKKEKKKKEKRNNKQFDVS